MAELDLTEGVPVPRPAEPSDPPLVSGSGATGGAVPDAVLPSGRTADELRPAVTWAVAVGWTMTTLYRGLTRAPGRAADDPDHLPGEVELPPVEAARRHVERIRLGLENLRAVLPDAPGLGASPAALIEGLQAALTEEASALRAQVLDLHVRVLSGLSASDIRLGRAYDLGTSLADLAFVVGEQADAPSAPLRPAVPVAEPSGGSRGWGSFGRSEGRRTGRRLGRGGVRAAGVARDGWPLDELLRLHDEVRDLVTVLPPHAGAAVQESLAYWRAYLQGGFETGFGERRPDREVLLLLQRQIHVWKALLLGEKDAGDSLDLAEYLHVGLCTVRRLQREGARVLRAAWPVLTVLGVATLAVVVAALVYANGTAVSTTIFATVTTALGAAWKSTRAPLVRVLDRYSDSLRDAEIDTAIARAISVLPPDAPRDWIEQQARMRVAVPQARRESGRQSAPRGAAETVAGGAPEVVVQ